MQLYNISTLRIRSHTFFYQADSSSLCWCIDRFMERPHCTCSEQLHTNRRRCWSSASAVRQSAEVVDRSALSPEQFRSSVFCCCGPVDVEFAVPDSLRDPALSLNMFRRQLKTYFFCEILTRCTHRIRDLFIMCYINWHFTYLLRPTLALDPTGDFRPDLLSHPLTFRYMWCDSIDVSIFPVV